jgi:pimeloyl-ACP methyl ester carboxylesterase
MASKYYQWGDARIHYRQSGMGDPIVLIHGLYPGASTEEFDHNIRALSRDFRVYAIDLLGFGLSDAPRIRYRADLYPLLLSDFIRDVIAAPASVIAAGESGPFAAAVAAQDPELLSKVVFISPEIGSVTYARTGWLWWTCRELLRNLVLFPPLHLIFQEMMAGEWEIREMLRRSFREPKLIGPDIVGRLSELARMPGVLDAYASLELGLLSLPFARLLPHVAAPALFISGACVTQAAADDIEQLSRLAPNGRHVQVDRAATWAHYEMPNSTNRQIASFLRSDAECDPASQHEAPARAVA